VSHAIRDALMVRAADFGIVLEDIAITHLSFGTEFTKAVEMKQVAEQDAERARFVVLKAEQVRGAPPFCFVLDWVGKDTAVACM
jgi:prohibitin 1